ncbi:MAG: alpha-galactosidase [Candidatus Methylacidiphilales bacterium]|nr:alpha-glucosidase/alpha-galactosidase [Candidatus Methylacidiphilales bacterium]
MNLVTETPPAAKVLHANDLSRTSSIVQTAVSSNGHRPEIKIAYLGGGSREWAGKLMADLALTNKIAGTLVLHDIDTEAARRNVQLAGEIFGHAEARTQFNVQVEDNIGRALRGADFVIISIEPGPTEMRYADLEIPAKYGILQTVGDTTGPGGILRALRTVPIYRRFAHAIMEHCPNAWVINYTNPMAICTAALYAYAPGIRAFGCCHEVFATQKMLADHVHNWFDVPAPDRTEIELEITGVNHFTWATKATWRGHDLLPRLRELVGDPGFFEGGTDFAQKAKADRSWFTSRHLVACDLLRRFGALGAAGDRHLVEFVPWYLTSEAELHRWGVVATPYSYRLERSQQPPARLGSVTARGLQPSGEEGVDMIEALMGLRQMRTNVNLPNTGQMAGARPGAIVETYAYMAANRVTPLVADPLPAAANALVSQSLAEQEMVLNASIRGDMDLAFQALLGHPLVRIPTDRAWEMFREMREVVSHMLPRG